MEHIEYLSTKINQWLGLLKRTKSLLLCSVHILRSEVQNSPGNELGSHSMLGLFWRTVKWRISLHKVPKVETSQREFHPIAWSRFSPLSNA